MNEVTGLLLTVAVAVLAVTMVLQTLALRRYTRTNDQLIEMMGETIESAAQLVNSINDAVNRAEHQ